MENSSRLIYFILLIIIVLLLVALITYILVVTINVNTPKLPTSEQLGPSLANLVTQVSIGASSTGQYPLENGKNFLDSTSCNATSQSQWVNSRCNCITPYFGPSCTRETYSNTYKAVGILNSLTDIVNTVEMEPLATQLSFTYPGTFLNPEPTDDQVLCTTECDNEINCIGVIWDYNNMFSQQTKCYLIEPMDNNSIVLVNPELDASTLTPIPYIPTQDSNLYIKNIYNSGNPVFTERVFMYTGTLPFRYWLITNRVSTNQIDLVLFPIGNVINMNFIPRSIINDGGLYGVFTNGTVNTTPSFLQSVIQFGQTGYVVITPDITDPSTVIPASWLSYQGIFVDENGNN